jgi:hypothetical protein
MRRGAFDDAWAVSDAVLKERRGVPCWHLPRHEQSVWNGAPLNDARVLVRCYHGLGDTIQFIRYAPLVREIAREVVVWAQPSLIPLIQTADGIDRLLPLHDGSPECEFDVDVEIMELPHVFRTTLDTVPNTVPYLHVPSIDLPRSSRFRVGVFWRVGDWDDRRAIPYEYLSRLAAIDDVELCMVMRDFDQVRGIAPVTRLPYPDDLYGTARMMGGLDLILSADSMPAHLAGALGVPVWTLLHSTPDWRWMIDRRDSPWYPTMRLFRQRQPGEWSAVVDEVAAELRQVVQPRDLSTSSMT